MCSLHEYRRPQRGGIAPLELVLSLPFLAGMMALIASLGWTALYRTMSCAEVRHDVWILRDASKNASVALKTKKTKPTSPLGVQNLDPLSGEIYGEVEHEIHLFGGLGTAFPKGRAAIIANTWDDKAIEGDFDGSGPHVNILYRMALGIGLTAVKGLAGLQDMSLPNQSDIDAAQGEIDAAQEQQKQLEEEFRKIIEELKRQYEKVKAERDQLVVERQGLIDQRNQLDQEIADLERQIADQNPPDPALVKQLNEKKAERNELTRQINEKTEQIEAKEREMAHIQEEIRRYEAAMADALKDVEDLP